MKTLTIFLTLLLSAAVAQADTAAERYQSLNCSANSVDLEKAIENSLIENSTALNRRMALKGFKGESLNKILDVSVECSNTSKKSYEANDRVLVNAFFQIRGNLCRFQFSSPSLQAENPSLSFEYIHCVNN